MVTINYDIQTVSNEEILYIHEAGYRRRYISTNTTHNRVLEVFEVNQIPTIYLNQRNNKLENIYCLTHCLGHVEFNKNNKWLKALKIPKMTQENLIPYMEHEGFDLFINVFRQLATTCSDLNSNFVAPINYFLIDDQKLCEWQIKLLRLTYDEAFYFKSIKNTKLLNEGYAVLRQSEFINLFNLSVSEKLDIAQIDAKLHYKPEQGLNYYSLGRSMWEEVLKQDVSKVLEEYTDVQFLDHYYNETVHEKENISVVFNGEVIKDFYNVKHFLRKQLSDSFSGIYVNLDVTNNTNKLTLNYRSKYYTDVKSLMNLKLGLEKLLCRRVYIKPLRCNPN